MTTLFRRTYLLDVDTIEITGLEVSFSVTRTLRREPNRASIRVWNLARSTRDQLHALDRVRVRLAAGLADRRTLIFDGELDSITSTKTGAEWVTEITGGDGLRARGARISRSYRAGAPIRALLEDCASALGVGVGNAAEVFASARALAGPTSIPTGAALDGSAADELTRLCDACGLEWSVQSGELQLLARARASTSSAVVLEPSSGLIGSPRVDSRGVLHADALMVPDLEPGRRVQVRSTHVDGVWRITRCDYSGDLSGTSWGVSIEGEQEAGA